uniref:Tc1-like transposase DDE domain-containing protein n=1 Tax=Globisporangium ultimum (strain ATCC 200006 / CBS 805.95 / DAOM BR144) TaxID=431595 RepID=K3WIK2_GLOUD
MFLDKTSKNGADSARRCARSRRGSRAVVRLSFARKNCVSVLAACGVCGFMYWETIRGTFSRNRFHATFVRHVVPKLIPWPLPDSIVVLDIARIHMYRELEETIHQCVQYRFFATLNPIEIVFVQLKRWLTRYANLAFPLYPEKVLEVAMRECLKAKGTGVNLFRRCGSGASGVEETVFPGRRKGWV